MPEVATNEKDRMITIALPVTAHVPGKDYEPAKPDPMYRFMVGGTYDIIQVEPGTPFMIEKHEGMGLVERFAGEVIDPNKPREGLASRAIPGSIQGSQSEFDTNKDRILIAQPKEGPIPGAKSGSGLPEAAAGYDSASKAAVSKR